MAITRVYQPFDLVPAYNDMEFLATSNQLAQPNFSYLVVVTVGVDSYVYKVPPGVNGECNFNARSIAEKYVKNFYPFQLTGWQEVIGGFTSMIVNIGEFYGTTPTSYTGSNQTFKIWNGALSLKQRRTYTSTDYNQAATWLNNYNTFNGTFTDANVTATIDRNHDLPFYFLDSTKIITKVVLKTYLITNSVTLKATATITNSTSKEYICINLSPASINTFITGTDPFDGTENYYTLDFFTTADAVNPARSAYVKIQDPCPVAMVNNIRWIFYQNKLGAYDFIDTTLVPVRGLNISRTFYKSPVPALSQASSRYVVGSTNQNGINPLPSGQKVLSSTYEHVDTYNSEWLTNKQIDDVADLFTTDSVFVQVAVNDYTLKTPADTYYQYENEYTSKNVKLVVKLNSVNTEIRQHE